MKNQDKEINCPQCGWQPQDSTRWRCACGNSWHVFADAARCPACFSEWKKTQCPPKSDGCGQWSDTMKWYGDLDNWLSNELKQVNTETTKKN